MQNIYASEVRTVDQLDVDSRATFIVRTYTNLLGRSSPSR